MGPVQVTVKTERQKSSYSKPNDPKPDYVVLVIDGHERNYTVENEQCGNFFNGQRGRTFSILAEGSREDATISYVGEPAGTAGQQPPPAQPAAVRPPPPPAAQQAPPARTEPPARNAKHEAEMYVGRRLAGQKITLRASMALSYEFEQVYGMPMPFELLQSINSTLFIAADRAGQFDQLPVDIKLEAPKGSAPAA